MLLVAYWVENSNQYTEQIRHWKRSFLHQLIYVFLSDVLLELLLHVISYMQAKISAQFPKSLIQLLKVGFLPITQELEGGFSSSYVLLNNAQVNISILED